MHALNDDSCALSGRVTLARHLMCGARHMAEGTSVFGARPMARRACPEGATGLSPGFQPWEPNTPRRRALKGRQIEFTGNTEIGSNGRPSPLRTPILRDNGYEIHPVPCRPFRASHSFWAFPGSKRWVESFCSFGAGPSGRGLVALNTYKPWTKLWWPFGPQRSANKLHWCILLMICSSTFCLMDRAIAQGAANYRLAPNDLLNVTVYDEPDLTAQVRLAGDGTAIFPLVGSVPLGGKTIPQATAILRERYLAGYLVNPQVSLIIQTYAKRSFTVLGQVQRPGSYEIVGDETIPLLQAVGMAGGYTRIADPGNITVRRTESGKEQVMRFNGKRMAKGYPSLDLVVRPGDVITVGESIF
jgi:protein involved in polysaccharide export with SLBB domain